MAWWLLLIKLRMLVISRKVESFMGEKNWVILTVKSGFYFFGEVVSAEGREPGYFYMKECSMFRIFQGGKGLPGVARMDPGATVTLDRFNPEDIQTFPMDSVLAIFKSGALYDFGGTTLG